MRSDKTGPMGRLDDSLHILVPDELKQELGALATLAGVPPSEYIRDVLIRHVHGHLGIIRLAQKNRGG